MNQLAIEQYDEAASRVEKLRLDASSLRERRTDLIGIAEQILCSKVIQWTSHRWGFAKPTVTFGANHFYSPAQALALAGDGFGGERIENAFLSGVEAAWAIIDGL